MTIEPSSSVVQPTTRRYPTIEELVPCHWSEGSVQVGTIRQSYYRTGGQTKRVKPTLVLLHGFMASGLCWTPVARVLEQNYDVIMVDARGHGRSDGPETGYTQKLLVADVVNLIQALDLDRPALLGHSNGATTALHVAATYPDLVRAILLEDPPARAAPDPATHTNADYQAWYQSWLAWMQSLKTMSGDERVEAIRERWLIGMPIVADDQLVFLAEAQAQFNLAVLPFVNNVQPAITQPDLVARITCPILVMTGNPNFGGGYDPQVIQQVAQVWRHGEHVHFEEAGHFISHRAFERYITVIQAFLQQTLSDPAG